MSKLITTGFHLPYDPANKPRAREMRKAATRQENKLWYDFLKGLKPQFKRQKPINHYIVDFYCPAAKLVIEVDGEYHVTAEQSEYDKIRTAILHGYGLTVLRFSNGDINERFDEVKQVIYDKLKGLGGDRMSH